MDVVTGNQSERVLDISLSFRVMISSITKSYTMLSDSELYPYSIPVEREKVVASGALTSLPVRIHR